MIEKYVNHVTLDLSDLSLTDKDLQVLQEELQERTDILIILPKEKFPELEKLINRNKKRNLILRMIGKDSYLEKVDLSYNQSEAQESNAYLMNVDDVRWMFDGLRRHENITWLSLNGQKALDDKSKLVVLAEILSQKRVKSLELKLDSQENSYLFLEELKKTNTSLCELKLNLAEDKQDELTEFLETNKKSAQYLFSTPMSQSTPPTVQSQFFKDFLKHEDKEFEEQVKNIEILYDLIELIEKNKNLNSTTSVNGIKKYITKGETDSIPQGFGVKDKIIKLKKEMLADLEKINTFESLFEWIKKQKKIFGAAKDYNAEELIGLIKDYLKDPGKIGYITNSFGLRKTVEKIAALSSKAQDDLSEESAKRLKHGT